VEKQCGKKAVAEKGKQLQKKAVEKKICDEEEKVKLTMR
jgi:hypothetical protein